MFIIAERLSVKSKIGGKSIKIFPNNSSSTYPHGYYPGITPIKNKNRIINKIAPTTYTTPFNGKAPALSRP